LVILRRRGFVCLSISIYRYSSYPRLRGASLSFSPPHCRTVHCQFAPSSGGMPSLTLDFLPFFSVPFPLKSIRSYRRARFSPISFSLLFSIRYPTPSPAIVRPPLGLIFPGTSLGISFLNRACRQPACSPPPSLNLRLILLMTTFFKWIRSHSFIPPVSLETSWLQRSGSFPPLKRTDWIICQDPSSLLCDSWTFQLVRCARVFPHVTLSAFFPMFPP